MDAKRYEELFMDATRWIAQARRQKMAGEFFAPELRRLEAALFQPQFFAPMTQSTRADQLATVEHLRALGDAQALLYGLAIENACKGRLVYDDQLKVENGKPKNLPKTHRIGEMVTLAEPAAYRGEGEFLDLLTHQLQTLSKYQVATDVNAQNNFTGRTVGECSAVVERIILGVLKLPELQAVYRNPPAPEEE